MTRYTKLCKFNLLEWFELYYINQICEQQGMCEDAFKRQQHVFNLDTFSFLPANVVSRREDLKFEFQDQVSQEPLHQKHKILRFVLGRPLPKEHWTQS